MPTGLPANIKIMPEYFKQAGYNTHAVGKESSDGSFSIYQSVQILLVKFLKMQFSF